MTRIEILARVASALDSEAPSASLARGLGVDARTVRRWLAGTAEPPAEIETEVALLIEREIDAMAARIAQLTQAVGLLAGD